MSGAHSWGWDRWRGLGHWDRAAAQLGGPPEVARLVEGTWRRCLLRFVLVTAAATHAPPWGPALLLLSWHHRPGPAWGWVAGSWAGGLWSGCSWDSANRTGDPWGRVEGPHPRHCLPSEAPWALQSQLLSWGFTAQVSPCSPEVAGCVLPAGWVGGEADPERVRACPRPHSQLASEPELRPRCTTRTSRWWFQRPLRGDPSPGRHQRLLTPIPGAPEQVPNPGHRHLRDGTRVQP